MENPKEIIIKAVRNGIASVTEKRLTWIIDVFSDVPS